jgi:hypothetical protein
LFGEVINALVRDRRISPFIKESGPAFLEAMSTHPDALVRSLAQSELALVCMKKGDAREFVVEWDHDPQAALDSALNGIPLDRDASIGSHRTTVSWRIPELYRSEALVTTPAAAEECGRPEDVRPTGMSKGGWVQGGM